MNANQRQTDLLRLQPLRVPGGWHITHNTLLEIDPDSAEYDLNTVQSQFGEDLFQARHERLNLLVDVGWYPDWDVVNGNYKLVLYRGDFLGQLLYEYDTKKRMDLVDKLEWLFDNQLYHTHG